MTDFTEPVPQALLNIENKTRSNLFPWRGQFSPQLIECLLEAYCPPDSVVLDPFAGSGTVLYESAKMHLAAFGYEIAPPAWSFSKLYEFANVPPREREEPISELMDRIDAEFPITIFREAELSVEDVEIRTIRDQRIVGRSRQDSIHRTHSHPGYIQQPSHERLSPKQICGSYEISPAASFFRSDRSKQTSRTLDRYRCQVNRLTSQ